MMGLLSVGIALFGAQPIETIPGEFYVKVQPGNTIYRDLSGGLTGVRSLDEALAKFPVRSLHKFCNIMQDNDPRGLNRVLEIKVHPDVDSDHLLARLRSIADIEYVEPKYRRTIKHLYGLFEEQPVTFGGDELPNDPYYPLQWYLPFINTPAVWDLTTGDSSVVIASVDLGVDLDHPDLAQVLWRNPLELGGNPGVDDDGNGWIDDVHGWDFVDNDSDPRPENGDYHGTHTAATAIASTNDGVGVAGITRDCRLMSVRAGTGNLVFSGYAGIYYAAHSGAKVIILSWGGYGFSQFEKDVVEDAFAQGCLLAAAAGNESRSDPHYPAAYDVVIAVAALDRSGRKAEFSNSGIWVDISAPGVQIFSALPDGQWGYLSGTSMAAPVVAGVGALAASLHPEWNVQQLMSTVIASGDPIDDINTVFGGRLGTGCVNAFRAVVSGRGGLSVDSIYYDDTFGGNGNGVPEPGETIQLQVWLRNDLSPENQVTGELLEEAAGVTLLDNISSFGAVPSGTIVDNTSNPFEFQLNPGLPENKRIRFALELRDENDRRLRRIPIQCVVDPSYADHDVGNVQFTITEFGAFGYLEYLVPEIPDVFEPRGSGFKYPQDGLSWLFHGSWVIGTDNAHVSDNAYGDIGFLRRDFQVLPGGELVISEPGVSDQDGVALFNDGSATNPIGIHVTQRSYAWAFPPDDDYVIVEAKVQNMTSNILYSMYIGIFLDWDVGPYIQNRAGWDAISGTGWMSNPVFPSPHVGIARVDGDPTSYRVVNNDLVIYTQGFPDNIKYQYLSGGIVVDYGDTDGDWSQLIGAGPFTLSPGDTTTAAYAIGAGDDLQDLIQNLEAARSKYAQVVENSIRKPSPPVLANWDLMPVYPNPYNDISRIQLLSRKQGEIAIHVYNILGQKVQTVFQGMIKEGLYQFDIRDTGMASGMYYCRLQASGVQVVQPMVLIR
jgi:serine protease